MKYSIYSGAGNDFVMINNLNGTILPGKQAEFTVKVCNEQFKNIDGVIFADKPLGKEAAIRMSYYNRDGSFGAMCGNGARCTAAYALDNSIVTKKSFMLEAVDKLYSVEIVSQDIVRIGFPPVTEYKLNIHMEFEGDISLTQLYWINVGSEHIVVFIDDIISPDIPGIDDIKVNDWGSMLRFNDAFQPKGANVNFVQKISDSEIKIRTYERGVERETLACGTGIISSAIIAGLIGRALSPVSVKVQSGETLNVEFKINGSVVENISLTGSARKIGEGELSV